MFSEVRKKAKKEKEEIIWRRKIYFFVEETDKQIWKGGKIWRRKMFFKECTEMLLASAFCEVFLVFFILNFNYMRSQTDFTQEKSLFHPAS